MRRMVGHARCTTLLRSSHHARVAGSAACKACDSPVGECQKFISSCPTARAVADRSLNEFEAFSLPRDFDLDTNALGSLFRAAQQRLHPDLHAADANVGARELAADAAACLNDAHAALAEPLRREELLLELHGVEASAERQAEAPPMELLMEIMEVRTALEAATRIEEVRSIDAENERKIEECVAEVGRWLGSEGCEDWLANALRAVVRLRYYVRVRDEVKEKNMR